MRENLFFHIIFGLNTIVCIAGSNHPLIIISFDGLQAGRFEQFIKLNPDCAFNSVINDGVKAKYMIPSFPTLTIPNHITLATGLNIESHGIVGNKIYDPAYDEKIILKFDESDSFENKANSHKWWDQFDPIWTIAEKQNLKTAAYYWPGSEAVLQTPQIFKKFSLSIPDENEIVTWLANLKIDLVLVYFKEPDETAHITGPDTQDYMNAIQKADNFLGSLVAKLKAKQVFDSLNMILVGDHGFAALKPANFTIALRDYVEMKYINLTQSVISIVSNINPVKGYEEYVYNKLLRIPNTKVYHKAQLPDKYFFSKNSRIGQIVLISDEGYRVSIDGTISGNRNGGEHGYDNYLKSMRTVFIAKGPNFKRNKTLDPFKNVNVYPLMCKLLNIQSSPNNGSADIFTDVLLLPDDQADESIENILEFKNLGNILILLAVLIFVFQFCLERKQTSKLNIKSLNPKLQPSVKPNLIRNSKTSI